MVFLLLFFRICFLKIYNSNLFLVMIPCLLALSVVVCLMYFSALSPLCRPALYSWWSFLSTMFSLYLLHLTLQRYVKTAGLTVTYMYLFRVSAYFPAFPPQSGESIMVEVAAGPSDSSPHEKVCLFFKFQDSPWGWGWGSHYCTALTLNTVLLSLNSHAEWMS